MHLGAHLGQHIGQHLAFQGVVLPTVPSLPKHVRLVSHAPVATLLAAPTVEIVDNATSVTILEVTHG
jgi:hypothetical protein